MHLVAGRILSCSCSFPEFSFPFTHIVNRANKAARLPCKAHISAMEKQPLGYFRPLGLRIHRLQIAFDLLWITRLSQRQSVGHPSHVCVDYNTRLSKCGSQEYICCFSSDARYRREFLYCIRDLAIKLPGNDLSTADQVFRLALIKSGRSDQCLQISRCRLRHSLRCWVSRE